MKFVNSYCDKNLDMKLHKKRLKFYKSIKVKYLLVCIFGLNKNKFFKKNDIWGFYGRDCLYQPTKLPNNTKLIKIHNNCKIAADVTFYEHDIINDVFRQIDDKNNYIGHLGAIEIYDNVFIGGKSIILGNVKIGPNAIIAAGSVVIRDVPEGTIVAGNPAVVVGKFDDLYKKRQKDDTNKGNIRLIEQYNKIWEDFYNK